LAASVYGVGRLEVTIRDAMAVGGQASTNSGSRISRVFPPVFGAELTSEGVQARTRFGARVIVPAAVPR